MLIKVKVYDTADNAQSNTVEISKKANVAELKEEITRKCKVPVEQQMIVFLGKQLENEVSVIDYKIKHGDTINLYVRANGEQSFQEKTDELDGEETKDEDEQDSVETESTLYRKEDFVDVILDDTGAWYEGIIVKILTKKTDDNSDMKEEDLIFVIKSADHIVPSFEVNAKVEEIRPRSYYVYKNDELSPGLLVLANYNLEENKSRGLWYDFRIDKVTRTTLTGSILVGSDHAPIEKCSIKFRDEVMRIEKPELLDVDKHVEHVKRKYPYNCLACRDDRNKKCRKCGCKKCSGKDNADKILLCDECDEEYHIYCLKPPLDKIPDDDWYCPNCKRDDSQIVKRGQVKITKKQANMPNKKSTSNRDWGRGMACAGRTTVCTLVPKNHFGPIPGVDVGTCWMFRMQASEAGVHRPAVSGIHGVAKEGAYSIVISNGYEDDIDSGYEFIYTGSGGRDLSGNKRVNVQSCDQTLTFCNKALAMNCNVPFNERGAESKNWKSGKPVRVIRNYKAIKHSKFAPKEGNRYDGIYKVVKYYPEKGKSGFIMWKFLLRRDDPTPAPWEEGGQEFEMILPPYHKEMEEQRKKEKENAESQAGSSGAGKRKSNALTDLLNIPKKKKITFELPDDVKKLIMMDTENSKLWAECEEALKDGKPDYLAKVQETFTCLCCQDLVYEPVTVECKHSFCKGCLEHAFRSELYSCPSCRHELGEKYHLKINDNFSKALKLLFPGYGPGS